jgi:hypothetical protein
MIQWIIFLIPGHFPPKAERQKNGTLSPERVESGKWLVARCTLSPFSESKLRSGVRTRSSKHFILFQLLNAFQSHLASLTCLGFWLLMRFGIIEMGMRYVKDRGSAWYITYDLMLKPQTYAHYTPQRTKKTRFHR